MWGEKEIVAVAETRARIPRDLRVAPPTRCNRVVDDYCNHLEKREHRCDSDISGGGDDDAVSPCCSLSSQGVQVSTENVPPATPLRRTRAYYCRGDYGGLSRQPMEDAAARAHLYAPEGGSGGSGRSWRWQCFEKFLSNAARDQSPGGGRSSSLLDRLLHRQRSNMTTIGSCRTTCATSDGTDTAATATTAAAVPQVVQRVRAQIYTLFRDRTYPPAPPAAPFVCPISTLDSVTNSPALTLTAHEPSAPSLPASCLPSMSNTTPEYLVAAKLQDIKGVGTVRDEPASPATSSASDTAPCWAERTGLAGGAVATSSFSTIYCCSTSPLGHNGALVRLKVERDAPRFLRPVLLLVMLSLVAIVGDKVGWGVGTFAPAVHAAEGYQVSESVVDDIFDRADKDNNGVIADEEIQYLVEGAGGTLLDDASEIKAGVESVIKHLDGNEDHALSRSDLLTYWKRLGTLLTVDEVAQWVVHAAQLPQEVADTFRSNTVTGYDFPELIANQGALLEHDLGVTRPAHRKVLVRSMKWKLWGMGEEPAAPSELRAVNHSCGVVRLDWDLNGGDGNVSFPVHKSVIRRTLLGQKGDRMGDWETVMDGPDRRFFDATVRSGASYRYHLQAWNALGHSSPAETDVIVAICEDKNPDETFGVPIVALVTVTVAMIVSALLAGKLGLSTVGRNRRATSGDRLRPRLEPLDATVVAAHDGAEAKLQGSSSPVSTSSNGGTLTHRETRCATGATLMSLQVPVTHGSSRERLRRSGSEAVAGTSAGLASSEGSKAATVESIRKQAVKRLMSKRSSSYDKELCRVCRKEWRWFQTRHTCGICHRQFCSRKECGMTDHVLGACSVGGKCLCSKCL